MRQFLLVIFLFILLSACKDKEKKAPVNLESNGVKIAYAKFGNGDTTLLFIHGWCINKEYWESQVDFFCSRYTVVTIDLPGFGQSGTNRSNWSFDAYADDIKNCIEQLQLKKVILVGHSMSGHILLKADNKYPSLLAGIVGIDNLHEPGRPYTGDELKGNEDFFKMLSSGFDSTVTKHMKGNLFQPSTPAIIVNRVMNDVYNADSTIAIPVLHDLLMSWQKEQTLMQGLSHKLYLVNSDVIPIKSDSLSKYCSKGFDAALVPATGHYPMLEKAALFNTALQRVIDKIGGSK